MSATLISIIMPCHNALTTLETSVASVLTQTHAELELICINDGSRDATGALLDRIATQDARVKPIHQANQGPGAARNAGLATAQGEYIAFLDADDTWATDCLEKLLAAQQASGADLAYCGWQNLGVAGGRGQPFVPPDYADTDLVALLLGGNRWPIHAALTRRAVIEGVQRFNARWTSCMDYDLWLRLSPTIRVVRVPEVLAYYQHHAGEQITKNRVRLAHNHWAIQRRFLAAHPELSARYGRRQLRIWTHGELLRRAYACYWARDLAAARSLFRSVMRAGYGSARDWKYMLPALLPESLHGALIRLLSHDRTAPT